MLIMNHNRKATAQVGLKCFQALVRTRGELSCAVCDNTKEKFFGSNKLDLKTGTLGEMGYCVHFVQRMTMFNSLIGDMLMYAREVGVDTKAVSEVLKHNFKPGALKCLPNGGNQAADNKNNGFLPPLDNNKKPATPAKADPKKPAPAKADPKKPAPAAKKERILQAPTKPAPAADPKKPAADAKKDEKKPAADAKKDEKKPAADAKKDEKKPAADAGKDSKYHQTKEDTMKLPRPDFENWDRTKEVNGKTAYDAWNFFVTIPQFEPKAITPSFDTKCIQNTSLVGLFRPIVLGKITDLAEASISIKPYYKAIRFLVENLGNAAVQAKF
jgi:hypothetical protein